MDYDTAIAKIGEVMELVYAVMGFKEELNDAQGGKVLQFIYFNYKELHPVELEMAFDLAAKGALKTDFSRGYNLRYLAHVLNSYVEMRKKIEMPRLQHQQAKQEVKREKDSMKPEDYKKMHRESANAIGMFYKRYLSDAAAPFNDYLSSFTYGYLLKRGMLTPTTIEESDVHERALQILSARVSKTGIRLSYTPEDMTATKMDIVVADLFSQWKHFEIEPIEYLTKDLK